MHVTNLWFWLSKLKEQRLFAKSSEGQLNKNDFTFTDANFIKEIQLIRCIFEALKYADTKIGILFLNVSINFSFMPFPGNCSQ